MKKTLALIFAVMFVLTATSSVFAFTPGQSVPQDEIINTNPTAMLKWKAGFAADVQYGYDPDVATDFYLATNQYPYLWNSHVTYRTDTGNNGGTISAKLSPKTNIGIFFGATDAIFDCTKLHDAARSAGVKYLLAYIQYDVAIGIYNLIIRNNN